MRSLNVLKKHEQNHSLAQQWSDHKVVYFSSNSPKNVHATSEIIPNRKDPIAKINLPKNRITMPIVMRIKETIK